MSSFLKQANWKLRSGDHAQAIELYMRVLQEQPTLAGMIQFNLQLAQKKLLKYVTDSQSPSTQRDSPAKWVSHETLQNNCDFSRIVLGGMVIGYPEKGNNTIPQRVAECAHLFGQIAQIEDLHGLRLFAGEELTRLPTPTLKPLAFVHTFDAENMRLASINYANSRDLRLSVEKEPQFNLTQVLRAYQYDPIVGGGLVLVGDCVLQGESWQLTDLALVNPYLPVLLTLSAPEGYLRDAALIPYPSLLPGGIHEHECYVGTFGNDPKVLAEGLLKEHLLALEHGWAMGQLQVDIREAIGSETILSSDFKEWLWSIFSLRIKPWRPPDLSQDLAKYWLKVFDTPPLKRSAEKFSSQSAREREGRTLLCPPRAIPSLRALTISRSLGELEQTCGVSQFILVQEGPLTKRWRLRWPDLASNPVLAVEQDGAIHMPIVLVKKNDVTKQAPENLVGVSAILMGETVAAHALQLIMPIAPDFARQSLQTTIAAQVDVVVTAAELPVEIFSAFLDSLALQRAISLRRIVVIVPSSGDQKTFDALLKRNYAGRYLLLPAREGEHYKQRVQRATAAIKQQPDDAYMVFINQPVVLHDPRTLTTLTQAFLATPKTVTASALLIGSVEIKSKPEIAIRASRVFPVLGLSKTEIEWRNENLVIAMPRTNLPVASHGDALFMIKTKDWKESAGFTGIEAEDENALHEFSAKLRARNKLHLLVPHVTVELHDNAAEQRSKEAGWKPATNLNDCTNAVCIEVLPS